MALLRRPTYGFSKSPEQSLGNRVLLLNPLPPLALAPPIWAKSLDIVQPGRLQ